MLPGFDARPLRKEFGRLLQRAVSPFMGAFLLSKTAAAARTAIGAADSTSASQYASQIKPIGASVAANALTLAASALSLDFRSTTLGSGTVTTVAGTPANLVVPSGATLGSVNSVQSDLILLALNNAGTIELGVVNLAGGVDLSETGLISTTAISASATSANVVYSTTARTSVAYRVIGSVRSTQSTAGSWATAPSLVQGMGGNALDALQSLGFGQTWQNVTGSRALATNYYNTTGKPITVSMRTTATTVATAATLVVNGVNVVEDVYAGGSSGYAKVFGIVPPGAQYSITAGQSLGAWVELR